jgi:hypothetical protein
MECYWIRFDNRYNNIQMKCLTSMCSQDINIDINNDINIVICNYMTSDFIAVFK